MLICAINLRNKRKYLYAIVILMSILFVLGVTQSDILPVFSKTQELPVYSVDYPEKKLAITFDCAWGDQDIPSILKTLKDENVKATFFIVGEWADKFPDTIKMISAGGHDIANHSNSHLRMGTLGNTKIKQEISTCGDKLARLSGKKVELFRAPYGDYNYNVINIANDLGYMTIQWDVDSLDWKPGIGQDEILSRVVSRVKNGSIVLFHNDTPHTAKILPNTISALKRNGYGFLPVSGLVIRDNYIINFEGRQKKAQ